MPDTAHRFVPLRAGYNPPCKVCLRRESHPNHLVPKPYVVPREKVS